jgi:3-hydroxyacyl-CoA dehydrogenase
VGGHIDIEKCGTSVLNRPQYGLFHEATQLVEDGTATAGDMETLVRTTLGAAATAVVGILGLALAALA